MDSHPHISVASPSSSSASVAEDLWRSLYYFGLYRLILGTLLMLLSAVFGDALSLDSTERVWFFRLSFAYVMLTLIALLALQVRRPRFSFQLAFHVGTDVLCITALSYFGGGIQSNLGMLLLVSLAAAGMISRGRITLFYAALASIAILLQHAYSVLTQDAQIGQFLQAGILSAAYFAVAWSSHALSRYAVASEKLAFIRGVDLSNMAEANRLMIQDMPDGVLVVDERGSIWQANPSAEKMLGYAAADRKVLTLGRCSPLLDAMFAAWRQNKSLGQEVLRLPNTNRLVKVRFLPVQREGFWGAVIVLEDMQRIQEQAQQVKLAALGRLTANIAHEVRNPLSSISYAAELLKEEGGAGRGRLPQIILDNVSRLDRIVQDVMQLNRRDRAQPELIDLAGHLPEFAAEVCRVEHVDPAIFSVSILPGCRIRFDPGHWEQVLWNLCRNALRYCQRGQGSIGLKVIRGGDGRVALEVVDDGPGVDAAGQAKLFEPFFTTDAGGTGLGLYIARELCEANGARLEYRGGEQGGACFRITFGVSNEG